MIIIKILLILAIIYQSLCQICSLGQFFNGQRCAPCKSNCICSVQNTCTKCLPGYTYDSSFENCISCPSANTINGNLTNVGCGQCCYQVVETQFVCSACPAVPYVYLLGGQCIRIQGCTSITKHGLCKSCANGYYLSNGQCSVCDPSCLTCIDSTFCISCHDGYFNATTNANYSTCVSCGSVCSKCTSATSCSQCFAGYRLSGTSCVACFPNCLNCSASVCLTCFQGYTIINGTCYTCNGSVQGGSTGCLSCFTNATTSLIKCTNCLSGYFLTYLNTCVSCSSIFSNSILCTSNQPLQCANDSHPTLNKRYYLVNNQCIANTNQCKIMKNTQGHCSECYFQSGMFYQLVNNACVRCNLPGCATYSTTCSCLACLSGYQLVNSQCVACQNLHCSICQSDIKSCQVCSPHFGLLATACVQCSQATCLNCDGNTSSCNLCQSGYYNGMGTCYNCQASCQTCTSSTNCIACLPGYYLLFSGRCKSLPANCLKVDSNGICTQCQYGHMAFLGNCIPCSQSLLNLDQCERYCPSYYAELQYESIFNPIILTFLLAFIYIIW